MNLEVRDNTDEHRFEAWIDGELCGVVEYDLRPGALVITHTEVLVEGKGVGSALTRRVLDALRADGERKVVPECPFTRKWIGRHPDYQDLVQEQ